MSSPVLRNLQRVALQGDGSLAHIAYSESAALDFLEKRRRGEKAKSSTKNRLGSSGRPKGGSENRVATSNKSTGCDLGNIVTTRGPGVLIVGDVVQQVSKVQDVSVITTTDCRPIELRFEAADGSYSEYTIPANYGKNHSIQRWISVQNLPSQLSRRSMTRSPNTAFGRGPTSYSEIWNKRARRCGNLRHDPGRTNQAVGINRPQGYPPSRSKLCHNGVSETAYQVTYVSRRVLRLRCHTLQTLTHLS